MTKYYVLIIICFQLFLVMCTKKTHVSSNQDERLENCRKNWVYTDLPHDVKIKVIFFEEKSAHDLMVYPNFIIGVSEEGDTIGLLDLEYGELKDLNEQGANEIKKGDYVIFVPSEWSDRDKDRAHPLFIAHTEEELINIHCSVNKIFYGKISNIVQENN